MKNDRKTSLDRETADADDIEIIEVVGLGDDAPPPSDRDPDEVDVDFGESESVAQRPVRPSAAPAPSASTTEVAENNGLRERLLRLQADFENFKKRIEREKEDYHRLATASLLIKLLPVIDNFDRALAAVPRSEGEAAIHRGVTLIHRQLMEELKREGLVPMEAVGEPFDPSHHEAVATDSASGLLPNTVVEEVQRGYFFRDRLLRPAAVRVSTDPESDRASDGSEET
jgi:molecular chaperone GrpE